MLKVFMTICLASFSAQADLTLYTDRPTERMQVITDAFTAQTGVAVNIVEKGWGDLKNQLIEEGATSAADVIMVKDLIYLNELVSLDKLQPLVSKTAEELVDSSMRSDFWTAITYRARTLVYHPSVDVSAIETYADLAAPEYEGLLCLRTSKSAYNEALVSSLISSYGYEESLFIVDGWLNNMVDVTKIYPNDNSIINEVAISQESPTPTCQMGLVNSYYLGLQMKENPSIPVRLKFLNMAEGGSHTNGIGAGVSFSSSQPELAAQFIDFMLTEEIQEYLSESHQDFPANREVSFPKGVQAWSNLPINPTPWSQFSETVDQARQLFEELDYQ